jgi:N-acetyl sugar amidotransferase
MHPLTVTWPSHLDTDIGKQNFQSWIDSGFDNILGHPDGIVNRRLTRVTFEIMGDVFQPFIYGVNTFPLRIATAFKIPLVFYGENGEVEYGGDAKNEESARRNTSDDILRHYFSSYPVEYWKRCGFTDEELHCYKLPPQKEMRDIGLETHFFGFYEKWVPRDNAEYAMRHTGYSFNPEGRSEGTYEGYASLDDKTDGLHFYLSFMKFGIARATRVSSHEIREGKITRSQAVDLLRKYDGEFPSKYFKESLDYMGMPEERFWQLCDSWRPEHIWKETKDGWRLRHAIYDEVPSKELPGYITSLNKGRKKK